MSSAPHWHPYDPELWTNPHPHFRRIREEAPVYYNEEHDFYALSRFEDVSHCLGNRETFISSHSDVLEFIKAGVVSPPALFINQDPPIHTIYRGLLSRVFTPARMAALEAQIRQFTVSCLAPLKGTGKFDFVRNLGSRMPMRVIGMLLGIPEKDLDEVQARGEASTRTEPGQAVAVPENGFVDESFATYLDWRVKNPSDDLMTQLMNAEFTDECGVTRRLTREEVLMIVTTLAGAGNDTTNRLIGWMGHTLGENPDQRRQLVADRSLITQAVEEVLRYEPPAISIGRYVAKDFELHGVTVPEGSALLCLVAAANRDPRRFADPERFDINRERLSNVTFGYGFHVCLGNALARVEGRVALDEILNHFPDWELDMENARQVPTTLTRGWDTLPVFTN